MNNQKQFGKGRREKWTSEEAKRNFDFCRGLAQDARSPAERASLLREMIKWQRYVGLSSREI